MKKVLAIGLFMLIAFAGNAWSQVIFDFEDGTTQGYFDNGWGSGFTSVTNAADPSGQSTGCLALAYDGAGAGTKGDIQVDNLDVSAAQVLMYWILLPADCPDALTIKLWAQDNVNWKWTEQVYSSTGMPRETWYPVTFDLDAKTIASAEFDHRNNKLGKSGIEIANWDVADKAWAGTIYVDNISMVGAEPTVFADFEDGTTGGFFDNGWGSGFTEVTNADNPDGEGKVLSITYDGAGAGTKGDLQIDGLDPAGNLMFAYWLYLPADAPDGLTIKLWAQDNANWKWAEQVCKSENLPKATWCPVYFNMEARHAEKPTEFDHKNNKLGKSGIEIANWNVADQTWSGTFYLDNASFLGLETGVKWVIADFENARTGLQGFTNTGWGAALTDMFQDADPTQQSAGVMNTTWDFTLGPKGAFEVSNVPLSDAGTGDIVTHLTMDVYIPEDMPDGAQVSIFLRGSAVPSGWTEDKFFTGEELIQGQWNTITYDVETRVGNDEVDPTQTGSAGCQVFYADESIDWFGDVYWDNFTLVGIKEPEGELASPPVTATVELFEGSNEGAGVVVNYPFVHLQWIDNAVGSETYDIYASHSPIDDLTAEGVVRIATQVPHGHQQWGHRPWTRDGSEVTYYYAVTAVGTDGMETELTDQCKVGPITLTSSKTAKAQYVADFANSFTLDGLDDEFTDYKVNTIRGESAGNAEGPNWTLESTDLNFNVTLVIDDNYLYISADVTDDDLREAPGQAWEGDALEFYMGFYNVNLLNQLHPYKSVGLEGSGDWRIGFTAWGTLQLNGTTETTVDGIENTVFQKFTGDGYIIEAKIDLDQVSNGELTVADGVFLPFRVDANDMDPANGDESRTLIVQFGGSGGVCHEDWKRPSAWGYLEVLGGPTAVENEVATLPSEFRLSSNYPNPFNPTTTLKYELPKIAEVSIVVYNVLGKEIKTLVQAQKPAGFYTLEWDGTNELGMNVPSGLYFVKMVTAEYSHTQKMMLLK